MPSQKAGTPLVCAMQPRAVSRTLYARALKEAELSYRTSSSVRLWWELEEPKGPKGSPPNTPPSPTPSPHSGAHLAVPESPAPRVEAALTQWEWRLRAQDRRSTRKVDIRLPGKGNSNSHGARPVHLIISMVKWLRTSRLSIKNSFSAIAHPTDFRSREVRTIVFKAHRLCITQL